MKRFELTFSFVQLPLDYLMLILAGVSAYSLRFAHITTSIRPILFNLPWDKFWPSLLAVALAWIGIFAASGVYSTNPNRKLTSEIGHIFTACALGFAGITIYVFFTLQKFDSRFLVLVGWLFAFIYVSIARTFLRLLKILCYRFGIGQRKTVIIGDDKIAQEIKNNLLNQPHLGYKIIATLENFNYQKLVDLYNQTGIDEIIFTNPKNHEADALQLVDFANEYHTIFKYSADLFTTISSNMAVSTIAGIPIIELKRTRLGGWGRIMKRLTDIVLSLFFIIIFSPLIIASAIIILFETGRPIIYKNERVGQENKKFVVYKFRSMYQKYCTGEQFDTNSTAIELEKQLIKESSDKKGPVYKIKNDPRITSFGRFIRRFSIDELPQFFNVLIGNMSLVGPRPHQPREVSQYEKWHKTVLHIKPGITGLAQISGRSDLSFDQEASLDIFYIEHWSLFIDFIILIKTPFVVFRKTGAW